MSRLIWMGVCRLTVNETSEQQLAVLASFVCAAYCPKGIEISGIPELRWYLFCKHMADSNRLPPTSGALKQHILRAHIQARVWGQASIAQQLYAVPGPHWLLCRIHSAMDLRTGVLRSISEWILQRRQWGPGTAYN